MKMEIAELYQKQSVMLKPLKNEINRHIKLGDFVVDLGCGTGIFLHLLEKKVGNKGKIFAIDEDKNMIRFCKKRFSNSNISFRVLSAEKLSSLNLKVRAALASLVLQFTNPDKVIFEIKKSLEKNGKLIFAIPLYRSGISAKTDKSSAKFKSEFKKNFALALKETGKSRFENKINFEYPNSRQDKFKKVLKKNNFKIITWRIEAFEKSGLKDMLEYYKVPWRSEKIVKMPFAARYELLRQALRNTFDKYPKFKVKRYYLIAVAMKND